jgi:hypothetical protein
MAKNKKTIEQVLVEAIGTMEPEPNDVDVDVDVVVDDDGHTSTQVWDRHTPDVNPEPDPNKKIITYVASETPSGRLLINNFLASKMPQARALAQRACDQMVLGKALSHYKFEGDLWVWQEILRRY